MAIILHFAVQPFPHKPFYSPLKDKYTPNTVDKYIVKYIFKNKTRLYTRNPKFLKSWVFFKNAFLA